MKSVILLIFLFLGSATVRIAEIKHLIVVDQDGRGDFSSITEAVNSLPMFSYERITILIKKGVYEEKIKIEQDFVTLEGENRDSTIIQFNLPRDEWNENKDSIGPAVVNLFGSDIIIRNLTVKNTQTNKNIHAFAVYGTGTRIILVNANFISYGGDTVSLWDYKTGMYYHANCYFEGSVDFVCPRGWCFIKNSKFYEHRETASVWHAGGFDKNQKFVLENCEFDGVQNFKLGRHHYDAAFYFIDCIFSERMKDEPIYRVTYKDEPWRDRAFNWGKRYFFYNSHLANEGARSEYNWMKNNISEAAASLATDPNWIFNGHWNPEDSTELHFKRFIIDKNRITFEFSNLISVEVEPVLITSNGKKLKYLFGAGSSSITFGSSEAINDADIRKLELLSGKLFASGAYLAKRKIDFNMGE